MEYKGKHQATIYQMMARLEDAATVPEIHGGYPAVALIREWREAKADIDSLEEDGLLDEEEADEAKDFLFQTVVEYLTQIEDEEEEAE